MLTRDTGLEKVTAEGLLAPALGLLVNLIKATTSAKCSSPFFLAIPFLRLLLFQSSLDELLSFFCRFKCSIAQAIVDSPAFEVKLVDALFQIKGQALSLSLSLVGPLLNFFFFLFCRPTRSAAIGALVDPDAILAAAAGTGAKARRGEPSRRRGRGTVSHLLRLSNRSLFVPVLTTGAPCTPVLTVVQTLSSRRAATVPATAA